MRRGQFLATERTVFLSPDVFWSGLVKTIMLWVSFLFVFSSSLLSIAPF